MHRKGHFEPFVALFSFLSYYKEYIKEALFSPFHKKVKSVLSIKESYSKENFPLLWSDVKGMVFYAFRKCNGSVHSKSACMNDQLKGCALQLCIVQLMDTFSFFRSERTLRRNMRSS